MKEPPLFDRLFDIILGIEICIQTNLQLPALILIYTGIDAVAWLAAEDEKSNVRARFQDWVDTWLFTAKRLPCSSVDLYGARCAILHTLTLDSDLSRDGKARQIVYSYGDYSQKNFQEYLDKLDASQFVPLAINDLYEAFKLGLANFLESATKDKSRMEKIQHKAKRYFSNVLVVDL